MMEVGLLEGNEKAGRGSTVALVRFVSMGGGQGAKWTFSGQDEFFSDLQGKEKCFRSPWSKGMYCFLLTALIPLL